MLSSRGVIVTAFLWTISCTDGSQIEESPKSPAVSETPTATTVAESIPSPNPSSSSSNDFCKDLTKQGAISAEFSGLVQRLCQAGVVEDLRTKAYKGNGEPELGVTASEMAGKKTSITTASLMMAQTSAKSYFNLMKLQVSRPNDFKAAGFETDAAVTYQILTSASDRVSYSYRNTSEAPEIIVAYDADANFVDLATGRLFAVSTKVTTPKEAVREFKGISVIYSSSSSPNVVEVFSISEQVVDNNDDHSTAVAKFKRRGSTETKRSYRNAGNASKADSFFK
jgi:hypothetical protein